MLNALVRMAAGGTILFWWLPGFALPAFEEMPSADRAVLCGAAGALALVIAGYILAAAHLYSALTLAGTLLAGTYLLRNTRPGRQRGLGPAPSVLSQLDHLETLPARLWAAAGHALRALRPRTRPSALGICTAALGGAIIAVGGWMRWFMPLWHAAPLFSDFVVVLAWVKQIESQQLFPGGVYLKGFHLVLAGMQTLTRTPADTFVKFAGPAVGLGMLLSVVYLAHRLTGRAVPALLAGLVYGTLPSLLPYVAARQSATDSQEFGDMLVLPAAWFVYRVWTRPDSPGYRLGAAILLCLIATVHPIAIVNGGMAAVAATVAGAAATGLRRRAAGGLLALVGIGAVVAVVPPAVGLAAGLGFYSSSLAFGLGSTATAAPPLPLAALVALGATAGSLVVLPLLRRTRASLGPPVLILLALLLALAAYEAPLVGITLTALETRSGEMVALVVPVGLALGWATLEEALGRLVGATFAAWSSLVALAAVTAGAWLKLPPAPFNAYRIDPDEFVAAYVQIERSVPPTEWLAVSNEDGYDYALGSGFFLGVQPFLQHVAPRGTWPAYRYSNGRSAVLGEKYIFIFVEKRFWVAPLPSEEAEVPVRRTNSAELQGWITAWEKQGGVAHVFFNGTYLRIYELSQGPVVTDPASHSGRRG